MKKNITGFFQSHGTVSPSTSQKPTVKIAIGLAIGPAFLLKIAALAVVLAAR